MSIIFGPSMISGMFEFRGSCSLGLHSLILEGGEQVFEDPPHNIKERGAGCPRTGLLMFLLVRGPKIIDINCRTNHVCTPQLYNAPNLPQMTKTCAFAEGTPFSSPRAVLASEIKQSVFSSVAADSQSTRPPSPPSSSPWRRRCMTTLAIKEMLT